MEEILATLDRREETCMCCGLTRRVNWIEHQRALELEAMIRKLRKWEVAL